MLIKARLVAGDKNLAAEFLEMIQTFRYPRVINENVLREIAATKDRIESEIVGADELERNVKLGRGGIREIEFLAQSLQLLHAGKMPFLQGSQTLPVLEKLAQYNLLSKEDVRFLSEAYPFLRDVEHRLQMEENLQTHTIPANRLARERLAKLMNFKTAAAFETARKSHTNRVRAVFDKLFKSEKSQAPAETLPREFAGEEAEWEKRFLPHIRFANRTKWFICCASLLKGRDTFMSRPAQLNSPDNFCQGCWRCVRREGCKAKNRKIFFPTRIVW